MRRRLAAAIALLLMAGVAGLTYAGAPPVRAAGSMSATPPRTDHPPPPTPVATAAPAPSPPSRGAPATDPLRTPSRAPTPFSLASTARRPTDDGPGPVQVSHDGTYSYRATYNGSPSSVALQVSSLPGPGGAVRKREQWSGAGTASGDVVTWSTTAKSLVTSALGGDDCDWRPPVVVYPFPLAKGAHWDVNGSCPMTAADGSRGTMQVTEHANVDGASRAVVGGVPVWVWVIERHTLTTETTSGLQATSEAQSTELFAPSLGLVVYRDTREQTPQSRERNLTTTTTEELLDPRPR